MSKLETNIIDNISGSSTLTIGDSNASTISIPKNITLGASGTTITVPSGATITNSGTANNFGGTNTPAFLAYRSSDQTIPTSTQTVVAYDTEVFDTNSLYSTSTYKFTPNVSGKYFVYAQTASNIGNDFDVWETQIYKNGTSGTAIAFSGGRHENKDSFHTSAVVDMNGSTDYLTVTCFHNKGTTENLRGARYWSFFGAYKIIE